MERCALIRFVLLALLPLSCASSIFAAAAPAVPPTPPVSPEDTELDFETQDVQRKDFDAEDFVLGFASGGEQTEFGSVRSQNVNNRPALATLPLRGGSQTLVTLEACAINQPHTHPRADEFGFVTKGELYFGFVEENFNNRTKSGGRYLDGAIPAGSTFVIPQGLVHFAINRGCTQAAFLATFPTKDPGTQTVVRALFSPAIPDDVLRATTGLTDVELQRIKAKVAANTNPSADPECLKRCFGPK